MMILNTNFGLDVFLLKRFEVDRRGNLERRGVEHGRRNDFSTTKYANSTKFVG